MPTPSSIKILLCLPLCLALWLAGLAGAANAQEDEAKGLELRDCRISAGPAFPGIKARCADFERPLDPEAPDGESITLRVAVVPALNLEPEPDAVVPIAGGPGQGTVEFYTLYAQAFAPLNRDRDILLVDQRGTGESARLQCGLEDEIVEGSLSPEQTVELTRACLDELPFDPRFFTTSVAVRDLEAVRSALGYPELNLYGVSYGSRVAQHYARRYPDSTRTVILDGVVPPDLALGPDIALEAQKAVDNIFARCAEDPACSERFGDIAATFARVRASLAEAPVEVSLPDPVSGAVETISFGPSEFGLAIRLLAYHPNTIALIPLFVDAAGAGNYQPLAAQFVMTINGLADSLAAGMHNSVMCSEDLARYDVDGLDRTSLEASYLGVALVDTMDAVCSVWPRGPVDDDLNSALITETPVLLLSGSADPITPPAYANRAASGLKRAWLLTGEHQGHGQLAVGCMPEVAKTFVAQAGLEDGDAKCFQDSFVMPFFLSFSGPQP